MSASFMLLFELEYINKLQCDGWNSLDVMTSVSSSMFAGLISTMSIGITRSDTMVGGGGGGTRQD